MSGQGPSSEQSGRAVPREVRRSQILQAAGELFAERGYQNASMSELARRVGVSKPVIYDVVGSKEALFRLCVESSADELVKAVSESGAAHDDLEAKIRAAAISFFDYLDAHRRFAPVMFRDRADDAGDPIAPFRRSQVALCEAVLRNELRGRQIESDPRKVKAAASAIVGAGEGLVRWWVQDGQLDPETFADWLTKLIFGGVEALLAD